MKSIVLFTISFLFMNFIHGQTSLGFVKGDIINKKGDTIKCYIELLTSYEDAVRYKIDENGAAKNISIKKIKGMITPFRYYENITVNKKELLMVQIAEGKLGLFKYIKLKESMNLGGGAIRAESSKKVIYVIEKNEVFYTIDENNFNEQVSKLLTDCKSIDEKLAKGVYKFSDLESIIEEYNSCN